MKTLGICSSAINHETTDPENLGYEVRSLYYEAQKLYDMVYLIDPMYVSFTFQNKTGKPGIIYKDIMLNNLSTLIVRSTTGCEKPISLLARTLHYCGCDLVDPLKRFSGLRAGKLFEPLKGFARSIMPETYIAFNPETAKRLILKINSDKKLPMVAKPEKGSKGHNVCLLSNKEEALSYIEEHFTGKYRDSALLFQEYIDVKDEFRVIIIGGNFIGMVKKLDIAGKISRNAAQGSKFIRVYDEGIVMFILKNINTRGIIGVDVVRDNSGRILILESNRSPQWMAFEKATGINVALKIIEFAYQRASDK
jgi:glutathione synthase/RimK-type ligase-like ATP-grasp enzyme